MRLQRTKPATWRLSPRPPRGDRTLREADPLAALRLGAAPPAAGERRAPVD